MVCIIVASVQGCYAVLVLINQHLVAYY